MSETTDSGDPKMAHIVGENGSLQAAPGSKNGKKVLRRHARPIGDAAKSKSKAIADVSPTASTKNGSLEAKPHKSQRPFPAGTFEDSLSFASEMYKYGSGTKVRRLSLFDNLGKAPESGASRQLIINASKYGLISGNQRSEQLELTQDGLKAVSQEIDQREQRKTQIKIGIQTIEPFAWLYEEFKNKALPAQQVMRDFLDTKGVEKAWQSECVDTFIGNVKFLGLLKVLSGAERLITVEHLLEELPAAQVSSHARTSVKQGVGHSALTISDQALDFSTTCFYVSPIGEDDSEERQHSDLFLNHIVGPAMEEFGLTIVRADQIGQAGMITKQIIEHLVRSKLVIADLSYHNPNVFYELAIRHACRLPTVQIIREGDRIPFDLDQVRTIKVDNSTIYTLVPQLETYKSQIANQVRKALEEAGNAENPISIFFPGLEVKFQN